MADPVTPPPQSYPPPDQQQYPPPQQPDQQPYPPPQQPYPPPDQQQYPPPQQQQYPPPQQQQYPPPQQQQYPPPQASTSANVTVVQTGGGGGVTCPSCQNNVTPTTMQKTGSSAWIWVLVIFLLGFFFPILWCGCCLIPLCVVKDTHRACPVCKTDMGKM